MTEPTARAAADDHSFFGHPRGLATLFFTEFWERFSYYGMRALLVLFMTDTARHGMGLETETATAIYGLYTFGVYALALPGGWMADKIFGQRRAVLIGGIIIAAGHYTMAIPTDPSFFLGMFLIVLGTGLLKPNVSSVVGDLYPEGGARRDAGFSIFYMGINFGALLGPLICGYLGEEINWHLGFGAAGVGMTFGLLQYVLGGKHMGNAAGYLKGEAADPASVKRAVGSSVRGVCSSWCSPPSSSAFRPRTSSHSPWSASRSPLGSSSWCSRPSTSSTWPSSPARTAWSAPASA